MQIKTDSILQEKIKEIPQTFCITVNCYNTGVGKKKGGIYRIHLIKVHLYENQRAKNESNVV